MKVVVILAGGMGTRSLGADGGEAEADGRDRRSAHSFWHIMKAYAHHGFTEFVPAPWATRER